MLDITSNRRAFERSLSDVAQKQLPFALSLAINDTLKDVKKNEEKRMRRVFDRPTPFTQRGLYLRRANKRTLSGEVGVKDIQAEYLKLQATGGTRRPKRRAIVVPVGQRLNKYGNMPKGALGRALAKPTTFVASRGKVKHLPPGIYQRKKRGVRMLAAFEDSASYEARWRMRVSARKTARARLPVYLSRRLRQAIATAR